MDFRLVMSIRTISSIKRQKTICIEPNIFAFSKDN